jgi:hypothetical protein
LEPILWQLVRRWGKTTPAQIYRTNMAQEWAIEAAKKRDPKDSEVPVEYQRHKVVFLETVTIPQRRAGRPDRPERTVLTKTRSMARVATRQRQYDTNMFSACLAEALRRHGVAVCMTRTSSSVIRDITDQLARLVSKGNKSSSNEDVPARHSLCGPERPP